MGINLTKFHCESETSIKVVKDPIWDKYPDLQPLHLGSVGAPAFDLRAAEEVVVVPRQTTNISIGVAIQMPSDMYMEIFSRSGLGSQGIIEAKGVGVIDSDYRGTLFVTLHNKTDTCFNISIGDRIAQGIFKKKIPVCLDFVNRLDYIVDSTSRGDKGFGSTGIE